MLPLLWSLCAFALVFLALLVVTRKVWAGRSSLVGEKRPPLISGWLPWVGCAVEFGKAPLLFIKACKEKHGDVFTIHAAGKHMTFLMDIRHIQTYMDSPALDFQKAVQPFTNKAAGLPQEAFMKHHRSMHDMVKGSLASNKLSSNHVLENVSVLFQEKLTAYSGNTGETSLYDFVQTTMFHAVVQHLFGEDCIEAAHDVSHFRKTFEKFDLDFEYGTELPELLLPEWRKCKHWLLNHFKKLITKHCHDNTTAHPETNLFHSLLSVVELSCAHNYALLLLWATQANAIPAAFWTLAFLHSHPEILATARQEVDSALAGKGDGDGLSEADLRAMPTVYRCVMEGIRIRSPGMITRLVVESLQVDDFVIPAGHYAMLSPYWIHRNEEVFPNPELFNPDRWLSADLSKNVFLPGFVAFGGGRYHCPGRWFALMEMQAFVATVLHSYNLELTTRVPEPSSMHLVGVQQPAEPCMVTYRRR